MWFHIFIALILPWGSIALGQDGVKFAIDYFNYRNVKYVCLLSCKQDRFWISAFSKAAFEHSMMVFVVTNDQIKDDLSTVRQCLEYNFISIGVIFNKDCENTEDILYFASENLSFSAQHKWLIIENEEVDSGYYNNFNQTDMTSIVNDKKNHTIMTTLNVLNLSVDADVTVGFRNYSGNYILYDVFNFGKIQGGTLMVRDIGAYDIVSGLKLNIDLNEYKFYRRWDFQNWTMRMALVASSTPKGFDITQLAELSPIPGVARIMCIGGAVLCIIAETHNIRYIPTFYDRWIAAYDINAKRSAANAIYFGEQDITPVLRFLTVTREKVDLLVPSVTYIATKYYYRIPTKGTGKFENKFLVPLNHKAWWGVIGTLMLCLLVLGLSARLEQRPSSAQYAVFSVLASICQQFYEDKDDSRAFKSFAARKMTILVTGLSCVLIFNYYTSAVVSWLLNGPPPSINSLNELMESPLELIFDDTGYARSWLQTPGYYFNKKNAEFEDKLREKKVFNKKENDPLFIPLVEGINMVQKGGYAYHAEVKSANTLISKTFDQSELCELGSLQSMEKTTLHPCVAKNSPYKEFMTWSLMRLTERGFISFIEGRTATPEVKCLGSSPRALALGGAAPAFMLLFGGYLLATVMMLCERGFEQQQLMYRMEPGSQVDTSTAAFVTSAFYIQRPTR